MMACVKRLYIGALIALGVYRIDAQVPSSWTAELVMNKVSIGSYFNTVFGQHGYGSYAGYHLIDFLAYARSSKNELSFTLTVIDMFHMRMKEALWTNPYLVDTVLRGMLAYIHPLFVQAQRKRSEEAKKTVYDLLLHRFDELREHPDEVIDTFVADMIMQIEASEVVRLKTGVVRLIENMLDRLIWSLAEQIDAWEITRTIADDLYALYEVGLLPDTATLNHCLWSLTYRFGYALESSADMISLLTYERMKSDIGTGNSVLFTVTDSAQRRSSMKTRAQWLTDIIFAGEVRARRAAQGAWTAAYPVAEMS